MQAFRITTTARRQTLTQSVLAKSRRAAIIAAVDSHRARQALPKSVTITHNKVEVIDKDVAMIR